MLRMTKLEQIINDDTKMKQIMDRVYEVLKEHGNKSDFLTLILYTFNSFETEEEGAIALMFLASAVEFLSGLEHEEDIQETMEHDEYTGEEGDTKRSKRGDKKSNS